MLDTNICIYALKERPATIHGRFNRLAEQLCISSITLGELHYGAEKSARRVDNLRAVEEFRARLDVLEFSAKAARTSGRCGPRWSGRDDPSGPTIC
jgi:tRNA(fMet)-specific endonuclease VapC